jgi:hypothetical protein
MHTESSLKLMEESTKDLGNLFRQFRTLTCSQFNTMELPREANARVRQKMKATDAQHPNAVPTSVPPLSVGQNLNDNQPTLSKFSTC